MILYLITLTCDFEGCGNMEAIDSDTSNVMPELEVLTNLKDWYWGGEYGEHFCSEHNSHLEKSQRSEP